MQNSIARENSGLERTTHSGMNIAGITDCSSTSFKEAEHEQSNMVFFFNYRHDSYVIDS
jgi:hypothetical protein